MEDGSEANRPDAIDKLHAQLGSEAAEAGANAETLTAPPVDETQGDGVPSPAPDGVNHLADTEETLASIAEAYAEITHSHFYRDLEPLAGHAQAERIANRAAMPPALQRLFAKGGARVAAKYGAEKIISAEAQLITAVAGHALCLYSAVLDRDAILRKHGVKEDPAPAQGTPAKPAQPAKLAQTPPPASNAPKDPNERTPAQAKATQDALASMSGE